jgi:hypothetical protein
MPDTKSGLETGKEPELDVNSDAGFNARLAARVSGDEGISEAAKAVLAVLKETDTSVQRGLTFGKESQAREGDGRFAPAAVPAVVEEAAPAAEERVVEEEVQEPDWKTQYEELERLMGRQGQEVGDTRKENAELRERLARVEGRMEATPEPTPQVPYVDRAALEEQIAGPNGNGEGGEAAWAWAANLGDYATLEMVAELWGEYQPFHAARRWNDFERYKEEYERAANAPEAPGPDATLETIRTERQFNASLAAVQATKDPKDWELVAPHLTEALQESGKLIQKAIVSSDPEEQQDGMQTLYTLAKARVVAGATSGAQADADAEKTAAKKAASVATGSLRPAPERKPADDETTREEALQRFRKSIMEAETTSVREGLTYGSRTSS